MRLGRRIALRIIQAIGRSATSLGYSICLAELIISPAMPSATTRGGGGVFYPIRDAKLKEKKNPAVLRKRFISEVRGTRP